MSFTLTPNLGLIKPTDQDDFDLWGVHLNTDMDILDTRIGGLAATYTTTVPTIAALRLLTTGVTVVVVQGYYAPSDGGGGVYVISATAAADNGGSIIVSGAGTYYLQTNGSPVSIKQFGARCNGAADDTAAWTAAITASTALGFAIHHPGGNSIVTGSLPVKNNTITGVGSYHQTTQAAPITQESMVTFRGAGAGLTLLDAASGGFRLERIGFAGTPADGAQTGLLLSDALRAGQSEGWPTLRDVLFIGFNVGIDVGNKYQGGWMWNVYIASSTAIGYRNAASDWYHYMVTCGQGALPATTAQLFLGVSGAAPTYPSGNHQFHGGAFFGGLNTVVVENSGQNYIAGAAIQDGQVDGLVIGNGTTAAALNIIMGCTFSGNNSNGGAHNAGGSFGYDVSLKAFAYSTSITGCQLAAFGSASSAVAAAIQLAFNSDGTVITGNTINMDNIHTPTAPTAPLAIFVDPSIETGTLDHYIIDNNMAFFGENSVYPFNLLLVNTAYVAQPYKLSSELSMNAGTAVLLAASGNIACSLRDPGYTGREMMIVEATAGGGDTVVAATTGGFSNSHTTIRFNAPGAFAQMTSVNAVQWIITNSGSVTLT